MEFEFIPTEKSKPPYGAPVLIKMYGGVVQHVTYMMDGADDEDDWFEPYYFNHEDDLKIGWQDVEEWALMPNWND